MNYMIVHILLISLFILPTLFLLKQQQDTASDAASDSRTISTIKLSLTFFATQFGGGAIIGVSDTAYHNDFYSAASYGCAIALGFIILALGIGDTLRKLKLGTMAEIFYVKYNSKILQSFCGVFSIATYGLILCATSLSAHKVFFYLGIKSDIIFIILWIFIILYTVQGGLDMVVKTDVIQAIAIIIVFMIIALAIHYGSLANVPTLYDAFVTHNKHFWPSNSSLLDSSEFDKVLLPMLFTIIGQDMGQRCFASQSKKSLFIATILAAITMLGAIALPLYLGLSAKQLGLPVDYEAVVLLSLHQIGSPTLVSLMLFAVSMAIISTADSIICAIHSNLRKDIFDIDQRFKPSLMAKLFTIFISSIAIYSSLSQDSVIPLMLLSYKVFISVFFIPIIFALFLPKRLLSTKVAFISVVFNLVLSLFSKLPQLLLQPAAALIYCIAIMLAYSLLQIKNKL